MTQQTTRSAAFDDALQNAGHALMLPDPVPALARVLAQFRDEHRAEVLAEAAAVSAAVAPPTNQTVAEAALAAVEAALCDTLLPDAREEALDRLMKVLPPTTDRAAVLREAADAIEKAADEHPDYYTPQGLYDAADRLRRMADETATEHRPAVSRWRVETLDNLANEWAPGTGWPVRALAVERFELMNAQAPRWKDGTPVTRRLVRETTTYTVEAETGPAAGARQDGAET